MTIGILNPTIGVVNADMFGAQSVFGEHVDWSQPDLFTEAEFVDLLEASPAEIAEKCPHLIIFEVEA